MCLCVCVCVCVCVVEKNEIKRRLKEYWECQKGYSRMRELKKRSNLRCQKCRLHHYLSLPPYLPVHSLFLSSIIILYSFFLSFYIHHPLSLSFSPSYSLFISLPLSFSFTLCLCLSFLFFYLLLGSLSISFSIRLSYNHWSYVVVFLNFLVDTK